MQAHQVQLVRDSFALVRPIAPQAAALFYGHLFDADPSLRALFRGDMVHQGERLMTMIGSAVGLLGKPDVLMPVLRNLGARHVGYGVVDAHYATVGGALLLTLEQGLGDAFTPEVREAWTAMYGIVSRTMIEASREPALAS
ncbi:globin family protein [Variovorax sp. dw_954]|uniref:globin family protein n=1 Tax=Variovorax sp. dw_954 TaxID=2720078 RepID=UPI001BD2F350|nr:globin family protein [Variovorax sp. dw_954]